MVTFENFSTYKKPNIFPNVSKDCFQVHISIQPRLNNNNKFHIFIGHTKLLQSIDIYFFVEGKKICGFSMLRDHFSFKIALKKSIRRTTFSIKK